MAFPSFDLGLEAAVPALLMDPEGKLTLQVVPRLAVLSVYETLPSDSHGKIPV